MILNIQVKADDADVLQAIRFICSTEDTDVAAGTIKRDFFEHGPLEHKVIDFNRIANRDLKTYHLNGFTAILIGLIGQMMEWEQKQKANADAETNSSNGTPGKADAGTTDGGNNEGGRIILGNF